MRVENSKATISLTDGEASDIAYCITVSLSRSIERHYNQLQQNQDGEELFFKQESDKLHILDTMYAIAGDLGSYERHVEHYRSLFKKRRLEREKED